MRFDGCCNALNDIFQNDRNKNTYLFKFNNRGTKRSVKRVQSEGVRN